MLDKIKEFQLLILGLILGLSFVGCSKIISANFSNSGITVTGTAQEVVKSDNASWKINVVSKGNTQKAAYGTIRKNLPIVINYLKKNGVKPEEISMLTPSSYPTYKTNSKNGYSTQNVDYYNYEQQIKVASLDVQKIKKLSIDVQSLVDNGVDLNSMPPEYSYSKLNETKAKLLEEATRDAKARAKGMLSATHNSVGKIRSVKMGVFQITQPDSNEVSDWGVNDSSTIDKKVTAVANVVFQIN